MENRFNLIDEPWIPVADVGRVSLADLFTNADYRALGSTPVQKIALLKFLLAIEAPDQRSLSTGKVSGPIYYLIGGRMVALHGHRGACGCTLIASLITATHG
jgi:hypothetical protein